MKRATKDALATFTEATQSWFRSVFAQPTAVQQRGWPVIAAGDHTLLLAPTGSGKTLAAFLWAIDRLSTVPNRAPERAAGVRVLYVSPLKALVYDIERNLQAPLRGIASQADAATLTLPRVAVRTGDTSPKARRQQARTPAEILVTTPESLYLLLGSAQRETLRTVETVIVDEVHALAPTKRGAHLALSLERLTALCARDPQRIGLSATARPVQEVARFLGGDRPVQMVDASAAPQLEIEIVVPVADMENPPRPRPSQAPESWGDGPLDSKEESGERGLWPAIYPHLLEAVQGHQSTIIFVNSRGLCERLCRRLNELAGSELLRSHHGSIAHAQREQIEEALKRGEIRGIVATSSLELGIDMGAVDLVLQVESPGSVARGLQRIGRAGHQVGAISKGRFFPKHRGDLLECTVVVGEMLRGAIEPLAIRERPLDVLAQQLVAACAMDDWRVKELATIFRRSASFAQLGDETLHSVLDMLSGRYPSTDFAELRPRLHWDRAADLLSARRGTRSLAIVSGGTIPDRGLYGVHLGEDGPRLGELDEEMVHETRPGQTFTLGSSTWRVEQVRRDRVIVSPAPGEAGRLPFWHGDTPGRPIELGRALGAFVRNVATRTPREAETWLREHYHLDELAATNLLHYLDEQQQATGTLPTDQRITVERFRDELGDWRVCILSPFGARVHAPWALALESLLSAETGFAVQTLHSDDGIVLRFAETDELPDLSLLLIDPDEVEDLLVDALGASALFASQFRENAARALLLPRRRPGARVPLWAQRLRAQNLLAVARQYPSFPIVLETYRACLQDVFDLPALRELLTAMQRRELLVEHVETRSASPFARSLVFAYVAAYMYQGDAPLAERRAQALSLDRAMLRELLGQEELRDLLDAEVIAETEAELQRMAEDYRARDEDGLQDALRRLGDLSADEIRARCSVPPEPLLELLEARHRVVRLRLAGQQRWVGVEDVALYRDALGATPPAGLPRALLEAVDAPLEALLRRYARTHGPFVSSELARRYGLLPAQLEPLLLALVGRGLLLRGDFRPGGRDREFCDPEVLRRLRRRTLAKLRHQVAPVAQASLGRFLPGWHGIGQRGRQLPSVLSQLEGLPLSFRELEQVLLPARIDAFRPAMLDELGAAGQLVWIGAGALGSDDGRVALFRRERVALLHEGVEPASLSELGRRLLAQLELAGASFLTELAASCGDVPLRELAAELWQLVWAGLVTNDTFLPLRALRQPARTKHAGALGSAAGGRWSLVSALLRGDTTATERAHARALCLLERHGILTREAVNGEGTPGGFAGLYPLLRALEEAGKIRRGYFIDGLGGAQFAQAGAVDRLRAHRPAGEQAEVMVLSAVDPANPHGAVLPWPDQGGGNARRVPGATVVLVDGELALYLDRGARRAMTFLPPDLRASDPGDECRQRLVAAAGALPGLAARRRGRYLRIERIDGEPAQRSPWRELFVQAGAREDYKGLAYEAPR